MNHAHWRMNFIFAWILSTVMASHAEAVKQTISREGLALWISGEHVILENGEITRIEDQSGNHHHAVRQKEQKIVAGNPIVVDLPTAKRPVMRFNGSFTGYEIPSVKNARTVFMVVSKHPAAFKQFAERFVLGGKAKQSTDYHVGCHWTDTLIELGMFKHGKAWFNGFPVDPTLTEFSPRLAVISFVAGQDTRIDQLARDRDFQDRSWHGDIGEILIYSQPLGDEARQSIEKHLLEKYAITPFQPVTVRRETVLPGHTKPPASLVPETPSTVPDYFCTWNVQGFKCSYSNANDQADMMIEANLFGKGAHQNWLGFYPAIRSDLTFLLDDAFDFPIGGGHNDVRRGSVELDVTRFPSYQGTPAERLAKLSQDVKARGWRDLGLWICNSRPNVDSLPIDSETYWIERLTWSQNAGIGNWKVDWGIGLPEKPLWKFRLTPKARVAAPDIWIEQGGAGPVGDLYRTYDVNVTVSIPETIRRIADFLAKPDAQDRRIINCEDEVYIGAGLGCTYGIMRHPFSGNLPNGKPDDVFRADFRDVKRRQDEVIRAVRWHRLAQPFPKGDAFKIDEAMLADFKSKPAPARVARGGLPLPSVMMSAGQEPPYVLCSRHPDGEIAVASIPRNVGENGHRKITFPLADVTLEVGALDRPLGIFGEYASLTLVTSTDLAGKRILAQDLAGKVPVDITPEVQFIPREVSERRLIISPRLKELGEGATGVGFDPGGKVLSEGRLVIPGDVIHRVGLMAGQKGDLSDPGLVLMVQDVCEIVPKKPMKPGK